MSKMTEGPWEVINDGSCCETVHPVNRDLNFGHAIATCCGQDSQYNSTAIASLPDLIEAAKAIIEAQDKQFGGCDRNDPRNDGWAYSVANEHLRALRSALRKGGVE